MMAVLGVLSILALIGGALLLRGFVKGLRSPGFREFDRVKPARLPERPPSSPGTPPTPEGPALSATLPEFFERTASGEVVFRNEEDDRA